MPKPMNLSVRLTSPLTDFVTTRVGPDADYDNSSEYVRDLIRQDREREERRAFAKLKATLLEADAQPDSNYVEVSLDDVLTRNKHPQA